MSKTATVLPAPKSVSALDSIAAAGKPSSQRAAFNDAAKTLALTAVKGETTAEPRVFSTGSVGWYFSGKGEVGNHRVQISANVTLIGSKKWGDSAKSAAWVAAHSALSLGDMTPQIEAEPRTFSTGSLGWYGSGRFLLQGETYHVTFQATVIGSKNWSM